MRRFVSDRTALLGDGVDRPHSPVTSMVIVSSAVESPPTQMSRRSCPTPVPRGRAPVPSGIRAEHELDLTRGLPRDRHALEAFEFTDRKRNIMIIRHSEVVAEGWRSSYRPEQVHLFYSFSKSFTSTAAGWRSPNFARSGREDARCQCHVGERSEDADVWHGARDRRQRRPGLGSDRPGRSRSSKLAVNRARAEAATTAAPMAFIGPVLASGQA